MNLKVRLIDGRELSFELDDNTTTVQELRNLICSEINGHNVRLIYRGRVLRDDNASLSTIGLTNDSVIHAIAAPVNMYSTSDNNPSTPSSSSPNASVNDSLLSPGESQRVYNEFDRLERDLQVIPSSNDIPESRTSMNRNNVLVLFRRLTALRAMISHRYMIPLSEGTLNEINVALINRLSNSIRRMERLLFSLLENDRNLIQSIMNTDWNQSGSVPASGFNQIAGTIASVVSSITQNLSQPSSSSSVNQQQPSTTANGSTSPVQFTFASGISDPSSIPNIISSVISTVNQHVNPTVQPQNNAQQSANVQTTISIPPSVSRVESTLFDLGIDGFHLKTCLALLDRENLSLKLLLASEPAHDLIYHSLVKISKDDLNALLSGDYSGFAGLQTILAEFRPLFEIESNEIIRSIFSSISLNGNDYQIVENISKSHLERLKSIIRASSTSFSRDFTFWLKDINSLLDSSELSHQTRLSIVECLKSHVQSRLGRVIHLVYSKIQNSCVDGLTDRYFK